MDFILEEWGLLNLIESFKGLWRPGSDKPICLRLPYFLYVTFIYFIGYTFLICEFLIFTEMLKDIPKLLSYIGMCLTHILGNVKLGIFIFGEKKVDRIVRALQDENFRYKYLDEQGPSTMFLKEKRKSSIITYMMLVLYSFVGVSAHISTLITIHRRMPRNTFEGTNTTCFELMPYFFYIPFSTESKWNCTLATFFLDIGLLTWAFVISYYDGFFVAVLKCFKIQLLIAGHVIVTLRQRCLRKLELSEDLEVFHDTEHPKLDRETHRQLGKVIEHIKLLLHVRDDIEGLLSFVTLCQIMCSLFIVASCMYVASIVPVGSPEFFAQIEFFCCILIQLSLICWSGNEITLAGQNLSKALYNSDWLSSSKRFKTSMILTMIRMQRPLVITIGKFTPLTLRTFVSVCRASLSYFAVFKRIK